jgi:competence protein ComGF
MHMTDHRHRRLVNRRGMSLIVYNIARLKIQAENIDHGLMQATG